MSPSVEDFFEWEAANPLLAGLPGPMSYGEMEAYLDYDPADAWKEQPIPDEERRGAAEKVIHRFVPVHRCVDAAMRLHQGLLNGLKARDPRLPQNRAAIYERAALAKTPLKHLPWFSSGAPGFVFSGSTGEGKSMLIERYLAGIPQVIVRPANTEYGWLDLKQLVWLKVSMPANGGRLGLLAEVAAAMDGVLGTDYSRQLRAHGTTIDVQLVMVLIWLNTHRCGLFVIEETQERTAKTATFGAEFLTYFLKILNWGIPTLLIGNPKALKAVEDFVQDGRRFAEAWIDFYPISDPQDPEWDALVLALWRWRTTKEPDEPLPDLESFLWSRTGGHRAALAVLRRESLTAAIDAGSEKVSKSHILTAFHSAGYRKRQRLIAGLVKKDIGSLETFSDFPVAGLAQQWARERQAQEKAARDKAASPATPEIDSVGEVIGKPSPKRTRSRAPASHTGEAPPNGLQPSIPGVPGVARAEPPWSPGADKESTGHSKPVDSRARIEAESDRSAEPPPEPDSNEPKRVSRRSLFG